METRNNLTKFVFTGPECSGKTTLSSKIAKKLNIPLVKEFARDYLTNLNRKYNYHDLFKIAKGQLKLEEEAIAQNKHEKAIICDTDIQVIKIWSQVKYSKCDPFIMNYNTNNYYILCYPDFKWEPDPLRENKNNRMELFKLYHSDLMQNNEKFIIAQGTHENRIKLVVNQILKII